MTITRCLNKLPQLPNKLVRLKQFKIFIQLVSYKHPTAALVPRLQLTPSRHPTHSDIA